MKPIQVQDGNGNVAFSNATSIGNNDYDERMEGLKKLVVALMLTLTLMPFFPRFWVSLSALILLSVHVNMYIYGQKQKQKDELQVRENIVKPLKTDLPNTMVQKVEMDEDNDTLNNIDVVSAATKLKIPTNQRVSVNSSGIEPGPHKSIKLLSDCNPLSKSKNNRTNNGSSDGNNGCIDGKLIEYGYNEKKETEITLGERSLRSRQRTGTRTRTRIRERRDGDSYSDKRKGAGEVVDDPFDVNVRVTGLKIEGGGCTGGGIAKYKLEIATPQGEKWFVWHKYSDICKLHGMVERVLETEGTRRSIFTRIVPSIPGKKQGYFRLWGVSRSLMKRRRGGLEEFFKRIFGEGSDVHHRRLALKIPKVRELLKIPPEMARTRRKFKRGYGNSGNSSVFAKIKRKQIPEPEEDEFVDVYH